MRYETWTKDEVKIAKQKLKEARKALALAEFGVQVYKAIYELTMNDKFAYQMGKDFDWDRVLSSKEFAEDELPIVVMLKCKHELIINKYK